MIDFFTDYRPRLRYAPTSFFRMNQHSICRTLRDISTTEVETEQTYLTTTKVIDMVNVRHGIHGPQPVSPVFLPDKVNGTAYLRAIRERISEYQETLPLSSLSSSLFQ